MPSNQTQTPEPQDPFIPLASLEKALRYWWITALLIVLGGLAGLLVHALRPTQYESTAQFSISIDYVGTGPLSQYEEDMAINTAGNIYISNEVFQAVVDRANEAGIPLSIEQLRAMARLERKFSIWNIRVRHPDLETAENLAAIWMQEGQARIEAGHQHAVQAYLLERYVQSQAHCLERLGANEPIDAPCGEASFAEIQANLSAAGLELYRAKRDSRGLFSGLTLGPFNPPETPPAAVTAGRGQFVLLGSLLGLLLGILAVEIGFPTNRHTKS